MLESFDDFFDFEAQQVEKSKINKIITDPVLYADGNPNLNVLIAELYPEHQIRFIASFFHQSNARIKLVYCFPFATKESKLETGLSRYFYENVRTDLKDHFISSVSIVTIGRAIYAATFDTDIQVNGFYDSVFNNTFFYSPFLNNRIYPIDSIAKICGFGQIDKKTEKPIYYFDRWETYFAEKQIERALKAGNCSITRKKAIKYIIVENPSKWLLQHTISVPESELWASVDSETGGFDKLSDEIGDITISFDGYAAYYLAWNDINPWAFYDFLKHHKVILANGKFDFLFFMYHGIDKDIQISWDTMIAGHILNEMRANSLKAHSFWYTNYGGYDIELEKYKWKYKGLKNYLQIPDSIRIPYACMDAAMTYQVWQAQVSDMKKEPELWNYYHKYVLPMLQVIIKMEYTGFDIDWNKVTEAGNFIQENIKKTLENVRTAFKNPDLDPNKKQELGAFIETLGWPCINRNKAGGYRVSKKELAEWEKMGYNEVKTLNEYSKWLTVWNTFIGTDSSCDNDDFNNTEQTDAAFFTNSFHTSLSHDKIGLWQYKAIDNKVHTTFHAFMTKSHRHRSSNPNLQNIPKRNYEISQIVRQCYTNPKVIPCKSIYATKVYLFDCKNGMSIKSISDFVEIGVNNRIRVPVRDMELKYPPRQYGYRIEYYKDAAKDDYYILELDGSNLQAKIAASMSHDTNLCRLFKDGGDFHTNNAYYILAKYQLFDECTINFLDGTTETKMEYSDVKVKRNEKETHAYYNELRKGDVLPDGRVVNTIIIAGRTISYEEYRNNAKKGKCKDLRQIAKMIGLAFIFGAGVNNLASGTLRMAWTPKKCQDFIKERKLDDLLNQTSQHNKNLTGDNLYYYVVAAFFRSEFFKLYPELEQWITECARDASVAGYRRSPWGSRRLLPQLTYQGKHSDRAETKNLSNISVNSPVQDFETVVMSMVMTSTSDAFAELGYISYMPGMVHDAAVTIVYRDELESVLKIELAAFEFEHPVLYGIPYGGECNVADFSKGEFWGFGKRDVVFDDVKDIVPVIKRYKTR